MCVLGWAHQEVFQQSVRIWRRCPCLGIDAPTLQCTRGAARDCARAAGLEAAHLPPVLEYGSQEPASHILSWKL